MLRQRASSLECRVIQSKRACWRESVGGGFRVLGFTQTKMNRGLLQDLFPFKEYFADAGELFEGKSFDADLEKANGCFRHLRTIFQELEECRAFELLKVRFLFAARRCRSCLPKSFRIERGRERLSEIVVTHCHADNLMLTASRISSPARVLAASGSLVTVGSSILWSSNTRVTFSGRETMSERGEKNLLQRTVRTVLRDLLVGVCVANL